MSWMRRPDIWLTLAVLAVTAAGSHLLAQDAFVHLSERDRTAYGARPVWQARFDALSATCGVGLLTYSLKDDYTPAGRWLLTGLGLTGALLYLIAARQAAGRLWGGEVGRLPSIRRVLTAFIVLQAIAIPIVAVVERLTGTADGVGDSTWQALATFSSLGWTSTKPGAGMNWMLAALALVSALGWPVWLLVRRPRAPHNEPAQQAVGGGVVLDLPKEGAARGSQSPLLLVSTYVLFLLICAGLVAALEVPRGMTRGRATADERLAGQAPATRFGRSLVQVICASGSGLSIEDFAERNVGEGTKFVLAAVVLIGGLGGSVGGGIKWPLVLWALTALAALFSHGPARSHNELARRCMLTGVAGCSALVGLALVVALGLLAIEAHTGSPYQAAPSFADALLDASSAVGGAGLTSGVTAMVTGANLSSGIRQNVDLYQYGMTWLMAAMFIGRVLPVLVLGRLAALRFQDAPPRLPPLI